MNVRTLIVTAGLVGATFAPMFTGKLVAKKGDSDPDETTPIKHVVVIFGENISFDHYFGTLSSRRSTSRASRDSTPIRPRQRPTHWWAVCSRTIRTSSIPTTARAARIRSASVRAQAVTADQDHDYGPEQLAFNHGLMDLFPEVGRHGRTAASGRRASSRRRASSMGYYDGNTVTALWNYAQQFAMSDNSFGTNFGPSTVGALNLVSGQTNGIVQETNGPTTDDEIDDGAGRPDGGGRSGSVSATSARRRRATRCRWAAATSATC